MANYRQGDIALIQVEKLPDGLKASKSNILMKNGSGGNSHAFEGGVFYPAVNGIVLGYLVADKGAKILHIEHGCKAKGKLKEKSINADVYQIRRQVEDTHKGMKPVVD